jgi:hypothetical protein
MKNKHIQYAWYLLRHKYYVFVAGRMLGVSLWRLLKHDWSKFLPCEWIPYANQFYGEKNKAAFSRAWLHHIHLNDHHWQHWILRKENGFSDHLEMPIPAVREMIADWMGAGKAITGQWEVRSWWAANTDKIDLHPQTRLWVEALLLTLS